MTSPSVKKLTTPDDVRRWAKKRHATPARLLPAQGQDEPGELTLLLAPTNDVDEVERLTWDEWLTWFDEQKLALLVLDERRTGQSSRFFRLADREDTP